MANKREKKFQKAMKASEAHTKTLLKANESNNWNKKERAIAKLKEDKTSRDYFKTSANSARRQAQKSANTKKEALRLGPNYGIYSIGKSNQKSANTLRKNNEKTTRSLTKSIKNDRKKINNLKKQGTFKTATRKKTTRRK